jgi:hypothetical protein
VLVYGGGGILSPVFDRGGGGSILPLLITGALSLRVRLSCSAAVSECCCLDISPLEGDNMRKDVNLFIILNQRARSRKCRYPQNK